MPNQWYHPKWLSAQPQVDPKGRFRYLFNVLLCLLILLFFHSFSLSHHFPLFFPRMTLDPITMELLDPARLASLGSLHALPDSLFIECILTLVGPKVGETY